MGFIFVQIKHEEGMTESPEIDLDCQRLIPSDISVKPLDAEPSEQQQRSRRKSTSSRQSIDGDALTFDLGRAHLSDLDASLFYRHLDLSHKNLVSLGEPLKRFKLIGELDVSRNNLRCLGKEMNALTNLTVLNASHNLLTKAFDFGAESQLTDVDLSHNKIEDIDQAAKQKALRKLDLSHNHITDVRGLSQTRQLQQLNLSHNEMRSAEGLEALPLFQLDLSSNKMETIDGCADLGKLIELDLSNNNIKSLDKFSTSSSPIQRLNLAGNDLTKIGHIMPLQKLKYLHQLDLRENGLCEIDDYRELIIFLLPKLTLLDGIEVTPEDTVQAVNLFQPNSSLCAALDHMTHTVYGILEGDRIRHYTLPGSDLIYPFLVVTGPKGLNKSAMIQSICDEFDATFALAKSHTTAMVDAETDSTYHYVTADQFQEDIRRGKFLQMSRMRDGELYGLTKDSLEVVALEEKAAICHMNLDGIRSLKLTQLKPRYVLVLPSSEEAYIRMSQEMSVADRESGWSEYHEFCETNRTKPGYFDMVIPVDSAEHAHQSVRDLVLDFLGQSPVTPLLSQRGGGSSRTSVSGGGGLNSRHRAEMLLESVRQPPGRHIMVKSAPELRAPMLSSMGQSQENGLLGELLETDITILDNAESTDDEWSSTNASSSSINHTPVLPALTPR